MKFLIILATVFCGGMVWVAADYYIELRAPATAAPSSSRGSKAKATYIYECRGFPTGAPAFTAAVSRCTTVRPEEKANVYFNHNFYHVYKPTLSYQEIQLSDRNFALISEWYLGYYRHAIDHPNFGRPSQVGTTYFRDIILLIGVDEGVPNYLVPGLVNYFAETNLMTFYENPVVANSLFSGFTTFLRRTIRRFDELNEEPDGNIRRILRKKVDRAIRLGLHKMIDPCTILRDNLQNFASNYCDTYCTFLGFSSRYFRTAANRCSLEGGRCVGLVCTCNRVMNYAFAGCISATSPMQLCHNYLREDLYD